MFAWGAAEAIALPVVPDVLLCLLALVAPGRSVRLFAAAIAGALLGSVALSLAVVVAPSAVHDLLLAIPGISPAMAESARAATAAGNPLAMAGFGPGIPLKVYTAGWMAGAGTPLGLLAGVVVNRLTRVGPDVAVAWAIGRFAPAGLRRHDRIVLAGYAAFWILVYVLYLR